MAIFESFEFESSHHRKHTHTHTLDARSNTHAAADSQRTPRSSPFSGGSPLVSRREGVSGSEDFLSFFQNQWLTPCKTLSRSPPFVCRRCRKFPPPPPPIFCLSVAVKSLFPHFVFCGHEFLSVRSAERGERVSREGEKGRKDGVDCEGSTKGLYRKSISPFHIPHIGLGTDSSN